MKLGELLTGVRDYKTALEEGLEVTSLTYDSRRAQPGGAFFAIAGEKADGHRFIPQALELGAVAIVSEREPFPGLSIRWIQVPKIRRALAAAAQNFFSFSSLKLQLIGVTGTNGKTTTAFLLESILRAAGIPAGLFGTIEYRIGGRVLPAVNTTPESLDLVAHFSSLAQHGARTVVMEVSSHALAQERVWGLPFAAAVFTNLTRDHLDYHRDFESYYEAKRRLFQGLGTPPPELVIVNRDDPWGIRLIGESRSPRRLTYGLEAGADVWAKQISQSLSGLAVSVVSPEGEFEVRSALIGRMNVSNILAAAATALGLGIAPELVAEGVAALKAVPGRFERIEQGQPFLVAVDYAHTDNALANVLRAARELTKRRLIVVFGCGGERDRTKRPLMGEAAGTLADFVVLTSDNPRGEEPIAIMNDVIVGLQRTGKAYVATVDREAALRRALEEAQEGDTVVIAGKGHETYQVLKERTVPFDDREVARRVLKEMRFHSASAKARNRDGRNEKSK